MAKRSNFARIPRDFYPTPIEAVRPLLQHLPTATRFAEPCAGDGALVRHLERAGHLCAMKFDIVPQQIGITKADVFDTPPMAYASCNVIVTNPPWDRKILHPMIETFAPIKPTWLLFDADWIHTKQSARFMPWLCKIVSVGRVKWFPDSKMTGKDNCAWHLFDLRKSEPIEFVGRAHG